MPDLTDQRVGARVNRTIRCNVAASGAHRSSLDDDELAVASVSVAEYRVGIELADTASRAADRTRALAAMVSAVDVLDELPGVSGIDT